jgi:putative nucleotidyltransferase-like protein
MARAKPPIWSPLPTATQLRLLRLVLAPAIEADALDAWTKSVDLKNLDAGSTRLLPALYLRLAAAGIDHPWLAIMRGWYRRTLYRNRVVVHRGLALVDELAQQGVGSLLLKGCPLMALYYGDLGARPMGDFDILIEESVPRRGIEGILADTGRAQLKNRSLHADTYTDSDGFEYDLHWYLLPELAVPGWSGELWARAQSLSIEGRSFRTLAGEDHLFHALIHGMRVSDVPPLRWIVDVATIAATGPPIDWLRIAEYAERTGIAPPVSQGLGFLLDSGILGEGAMAARAALGAAPVKDRLLFAGLMRPPSLAFRCLRPWLIYRRLARLSRAAGLGGWDAGFARFLADLWNLESPRQIPGDLWRKIAGRLRARLARS